MLGNFHNPTLENSGYYSILTKSSEDSKNKFNNKPEIRRQLNLRFVFCVSCFLYSVEMKI